MPILSGNPQSDNLSFVQILLIFKTFVTAGLSKVLKINNICGKEHLTDCGIPAKYTNLTGSQFDMPTTMEELNPVMTSVSYDYIGSKHFSYEQADSDAVAFETGNGESIVVFYNPNCRPDMGEVVEYYVQPKICAHFIYDLNGSKGPNTVGKDIGAITVLYPADTVVVAPFPALRNLSANYKQAEAGRECTNFDSEYRLPNIEELISLFINQRLYGSTLSSSGLWSSTLVDSTKALYIGQGSGCLYTGLREAERGVRCVKR